MKPLELPGIPGDVTMQKPILFPERGNRICFKQGAFFQFWYFSVETIGSTMLAMGSEKMIQQPITNQPIPNQLLHKFPFQRFEFPANSYLYITSQPKCPVTLHYACPKEVQYFID